MSRPRPHFVVVILAALVAVVSALPSNAATSGTVVGATVPSAVSLSSTCHDRAAWSFGSVLPGSALRTATGANVCRFTWSSSNSSSMLRMHQSDRLGAAMVGQTSSWNLVGPQANPYNRFDGRGSIYIGANDWSGNPMRHSTDSGQTFGNLATAGTYQHVSMAGATTAWRAGNSGVQRSFDMNLATPSWTTVATAVPAGGGADVDSVDALSGTVAWVTRYDNVYLTTDGGSTWVSELSSPIAGNIEAASATIAFGTGWAGQLSRTIDGNLTWNSAMTGISAHVGESTVDVSVAPGTPTTVWFLNSTGVYRSVNSGANWSTTTALPDALRPVSLTAVSASEAYVGGDDGVIFRTTDSGVTWNRLL